MIRVHLVKIVYLSTQRQLGLFLLSTIIFGIPHSGSAQNSAWSKQMMTHMRTYSMFGQSQMLHGIDHTQIIKNDLSLMIQRIRPTVEIYWRDFIAFEVAYDVIPMIGGSQSASISSFAVQQNQALRLIDFNTTLKDSSTNAWLVRHNLDRLTVRIGRPGKEIKLGRQAFNHGSARIFPATDIFVPFGPGTINTEFKRGVDGIRMTYAINEDHEIEIYGIAHQPTMNHGIEVDQWMYLIRWRAIFPKVLDSSCFAGSSYTRPTFGLDISSSLFGATVYAEAFTRLARLEEEKDTMRASLGVDYQWSMGLQNTIEVHYNSIGSLAPYMANDMSTTVNQTIVEQEVGESYYLGRWYLGTHLGYQWDLLSAHSGVIMNLQDQSMMITAHLSYDFAENVVLGLGGLVPIGHVPILQSISTPSQSTITTPSATNTLNKSRAATLNISQEFAAYPMLVFTDIRLTF
jgi:hypothetical protein